MSVSLAVILDTRRIKMKTGKYPLKLRVTHERTPRYYTTLFELTEEDFNKISASRVSEQLQRVREKILEITRTAGEVACKLNPFSFAEFEKDYILNNPLFKQKKFKAQPIHKPSADFDFTPYHKKFSIFKDDHSRLGTMSVTYFDYIKRLIQEKRKGTAMSYHCSYRSLMKYCDSSCNFTKRLILQAFSILIVMGLSENMLLIRKKKGISQAELGKMIGTSGDVIGRYERGDISPSVEVVAKIADTLEVSVDYLLGKTSLELDKQALQRLEDISKLSPENKNFVLNLIDMALREINAKKAYSK